MKPFVLIIGLLLSLNLFSQNPYEEDYNNGIINYAEFLFACSGNDYFNATRNDSIIIPFYEKKLSFPLKMSPNEVENFCDFEIIKNTNEVTIFNKKFILNDIELNSNLLVDYFHQEIKSVQIIFESPTNSIEFENLYNKLYNFLNIKLGQINETNYSPENLKDFSYQEKFNHLNKYEYSRIITTWNMPNLNYKLNCTKLNNTNLAIYITINYQSQYNRDIVNNIK